MKREDLERKHELYKANIEEWNFYTLTYDGGMPFIEYCLYHYSTRESVGNWKDRLKNGYTYNYAQSIVDLFNYYLTDAPVVRNVGKLADDPQFQMFNKDCDLKNTDYNVYMDEIQKLSSVCGSIGTLVNKPNFEGRTVQDEIRAGVYPYLSAYSLQNIFDWRFERNPITHRMELTFLKLYEEDQTYLLWWKDHWQRWEIEKKTNVPRMVSDGVNPLSEIPFVWMPNVKRMRNSYLGVSDIVDVSRIVASIVRNLSCGEEILKLAGFPMMRIPMEKDLSVDGGDDDEQHQTGPRVVHEFDPTMGEAGKPDWMPTEIYEPIQAILDWIDRKSNECYRVSHLSGVHGQRTSNEAQSGLALRYSFQQLFSVLGKKSENMTEAEYQILRFWMKWQGLESEFENVEVSRTKEFSIDDLAVELDNAFTAMRNMVSKTYRIRMQDKVRQHTLPDLPREDVDKIKAETEEKTPEDIPIFHDDPRNQTGGGKKVRPADQAKNPEGR